MAKFYRFETVDIPLKFTPTGVLNDYKHIVVTISQDNMIKIDKTEDELIINENEDRIILSLSQEETGKFAGGKTTPRIADIQVNIYYETAKRDVSTVGTIEVYDNLYKEVITDE